MKPLRIGIVGMGWVAGAHIDAFKGVDGADVTAVCSRRSLDPADLQARHGVPLKVYNRFEDLIADPDIDLVDICTPHPFHPEQAIAAARAGKHLIIEKPIGIRWEDCLAVRDAIRESRVQTCVCFEVRFSRQAQAIHATIQQGHVGDLHLAEVDYFHGIGPWYGQYEWNRRADFGGSSLLTAGCHALDLLRHFMPGDVVETTSIQTRSTHPAFANYEYPTTSVTLLRYADGRIGKVTSCIDCVQPYYFHIHLVGSQGSILDNKFTATGWPGLEKDIWSNLGVPTVDSGDVRDHPYPPQFQAFVNSVRAGQPMPHTDFDTALETHRIVFAADRSAALGRSVRLDELPF